MKTLLHSFLTIAVALTFAANAETNPPPTFRLSGTVVDAEGRPVTDAVVESYQRVGDISLGRGDMELKQRVTTGTNGAFEFSLPRAATVLLARKPGVAPAWKEYWNPTKDVSEERLVVTAPTTLAGVVVDETDKPVADAEVFVSLAFTEISLAGGGRTFSSLDGKLARECFSTRTGADGRFRIEGFPTDATADLAVIVPGKALRQPPREYIGPDSMQCRAGDQDIKLTVEPASSIEGKVVAEETGQPISGARLWLQPDRPGFFGPGEREPAQSSTDGVFRIADVAAGSYRIRTVFGTNAVPDWVAETVPVSVESGQTNRDVQIKATRGGLLEVTVLRKNDRKPVAQVGVNAFKENFRSGVASGTNGVALLRLPSGEYQVSATKDHWRAENVAATVEAGKTNRAEIELAPPPKISGVVHNPDGTPASGLKVIMVGGYSSPDEGGTKTDADGRFEMEWDPQRYGRSDMTFFLLVRDPERNLAVAQEIDEDTGPLDLKLAPALTLAGRAECDGQPITNVNATLVFWTGNRGMHLAGLSRGTNVPGRFEIPALPPDRRYGVNVSAPGYGQKYVNVAETEVQAGRVELDPVELKVANLKVAGQVVDSDDKPVVGAHVSLYGEGQPNANTRTDRDGRFSFDRVCEGQVQLSASARNSHGSISAEGGDTNAVLRLGESVTYGGSSPPRKLKGTVTGPDGKPAVGVQVAVFASGSMRWVKTDTNGAFNLTWSIEPWQSGSPCLIARDPKGNLAVAEDINEDTTTANLQLKPGLVVTGRVEDPNGKPLTNATVEIQLRAGNSSSTFDSARIVVDAQGRFEINTLPPDRQYLLWITAKGYGSARPDVESGETETNRIELAPVVLKVADRKLAGQVVNSEDKPVAGANVYMYGEDQPNTSVRTDKQGRFKFDQVCGGQVQLSANYQNSYANARADAGDTNVVITLSSDSGSRRARPRRASLIGKPLPDLTVLNLASNAVPAGQPLLLCLFDLEQRPSRRCVRLLSEQHDALKQKGLAVLAVQTTPTTAEALQSWNDASPVPFPVGCVAEKSDQTKWVSGVESLPWLILADAQGRVIAEGFALDELDAKLKAAAK